MGRSLRILSIMILLIQISSCTNEAPQNTPEIIGTVTDTDGNLINDVNVYFVYHFNDIPLQQIAKVNNVDTVSLLYFRAEEYNPGIQLNWGTASELNNKGFEVERKYGNTDYTAIGFVEGNGTSNTPHDYTFIDNNVISGTYYYKLKQVDFDGTSQYSQEVMVTTSYYGPDSLYQNYPNPFFDMTTASYSLSDSASTKLDFVDYQSQGILFNYLDKTMTPGRYFITLHNLNDYPNDIYKLKLSIKKNNSTEINQIVDIFINRTDTSLLQQCKSNCYTVNGKFEFDMAALPFHKIVRFTSETSPDINSEKEVTDLITFVLVKDGYKTLELDYSIDEFNQNNFTFIMERQ